ncbi:MAG: type II toxin-antitoxin system VapC family toxin [Acidobacteriota bacterium]|jgi:hypothetical protein
MILLDANLLIYAVNESLPQHRAARAWLEGVLSGNEAVGLPWVCILAFLRITTRSDIFARPLTPEEAVGYVDAWLQQPFVRPLAADDKHWAVLRNLLAVSGLAGNLTSDAHVAALALESGATVFSADNDFKRFAGVRHVNPLA